MCQMSPVWLTSRPGRKQFTFNASAVNDEAWEKRGQPMVHKLEPALGAPMTSGHQELPGFFWQWRQWVLLDPGASVSAELLVGCDAVPLREREAKKISRQRDFGVIQTEWWASWRLSKKTFVHLGLLLVRPSFGEHGKGLLPHSLWPEAGLTVVFLKAALCISVSTPTDSFCSSSCSPSLWEYSSLGSWPLPPTPVMAQMMEFESNLQEVRNKENQPTA